MVDVEVNANANGQHLTMKCNLFDAAAIQMDSEFESYEHSNCPD